MNYSTAIFLINKDVRAVNVSYEVDANGDGKRPFYTFKTLDQSIKAGDFVVIPTDSRHNHTVARVEEADVEIDFDSNVQIKWLTDRVDVTAANTVIAQEAEAIQRMKSAETRAKRDELAKKLLADNPDLSGLTIANTAATALPAE